MAFAQTPHPWELGIGLGIASHYGETNNIQFGQPVFGIHPAYAVHGRKNLNNKFSTRLNFLYTGLSGADQNYSAPSWRQIRGLSFNADLFEFTALAEYYPFGLYQKRGRKAKSISKNRRLLAPFVALGLGGNFDRPKVDWNEEQPNEFVDPKLAQIDKVQPNKPDISIPMGLGIRIRTTNRLTIGLESIISLTLNDYLDGISVAGDPGSSDWFFTVQATASYSFGKGVERTRKTANRMEKAEVILPDKDADSIPDEKDACPDVPGLSSLNGCPDTDGDGITDKEDHCPALAGVQTLNGCPDADEDGIADKDDHCPELKGVLAYEGCPAVDRDNDGVADADDLCPDMRGQVRWKGCPDSDQDGIPDNKDGCPGIAGPQSLKGCPDSDLDGISDKEDDCPTLAGSLEKKGCPDVLAPALGFPYKAIYFSSTLQDWYTTSVATLDEIVGILQSDPAMFARLEGHTDDTGKEPANDLLAERRAKKCLDYIAAKGIDPKRMNYLGYGSHRPIVPNDSRSNRQLNRRVEVYFYKK